MTKDDIKKAIRNGDYITLGEMLGCDSNAARMRFNRGNTEAIEAMEKIVTQRKELTQKS